jgi:hypothetical protein
MGEPGSAVNELQPWSARTVRRVTRRARTAWLGATAWLSGWGVGGVFVVLLVAAVLAIFVLAPLVSRHSDGTPCDQASGLVGQIQTMQSDEHGALLDRDMVRDLHRIAARLTPIADQAYGSAADPLKALAANVSNVHVGQHLHAGSALNQVSIACPRP